MRQFYLLFPIRHTVCDELSWSHYRHLIRVENEHDKDFAIDITSNGYLFNTERFKKLLKL